MSEILFARLDELTAAIAGVTSHGTFFSPTLTGNILFGPVYQNTNPANAGMYGVIANSPSGSNTIFNAFQVSQGTPIPATQQFRSNTVGVQQAVVGTVQNVAGDLTTYHMAGGAFYALTNQGAGVGIAATVGVFGQGMTNVTNASVFGGNVVAMNSNGTAGAFGYDTNFIVGLEIDVNMSQKSGSVNPTSTLGHLYGLVIAGDSTLTAPIVGSSGIVIDRLSVNTNVPWYYGFSTYDNSAVIGIGLGALGTGNSVNSQPIQMTGRDAGGVARIVDIHSDLNGALILAPDSNSGVTAILDGLGLGAAFQIATVFSNTHINIPSLSTAGVITNNTSGSFVSTASLSTTLGGLGANNSASTGIPLFAAGVVTMTATSGSGNIARTTSPVFTTPSLGVAVATSLNGNNFTVGTYTLTGSAGKTLTFNNSLTLAGTDTTTMTFPTTNASIARTDAAQSFTGVQTFSSTIVGSINGNAATVTTNANLTGDITSVGNATTLTNAPVIAKVLTGYSAGAGTIAATDSILQAFQKVGGLVDNGAWTAYTPVVVGTGATPTYTSTGRWKAIGKTIHVELDVTYTGNVVGLTTSTISLPVTSANASYILMGKENAVSGSVLSGTINNSSAVFTPLTYNNVPPVTLNQRLIYSGIYEAA